MTSSLNEEMTKALPISLPTKDDGAYFTMLQRDGGERRLFRDDEQDDACCLGLAQWKSSGSTNHHYKAPLCARSTKVQQQQKSLSLKKEKASRSFYKQVPSDEKLELEKILKRSKELPGTWYFSSIHVLVNKERTKRKIPELIRSRELDEIAVENAERMASTGKVRHSNPKSHQFKLSSPCRRLGENVAVGEKIRSIHKSMMEESIAEKNNILDRRFTSMGMGCVRGKGGQLFICQIFRS